METNIDESIETKTNNDEPVEVSKLNDDSEALILSGDATNNDQITIGNPVTVETHDDQVIVGPVGEVICKENDKQAVDGDGRRVFEESQVTEKSLGVADISPDQKVRS